MNVNHEEREDILQEIMLIAWKQLPEFDYDSGRGKFRSWLCTIVQRTVYRKNEKSQTSVKREEAYFADSSLVLDAEIEELSLKEWQRYISELAWEKVSIRFDAPIIECFQRLVNGEKGELVAEDLKLSQNSVYVYKKRVISALQKEIASLESELN